MMEHARSSKLLAGPLHHLERHAYWLACDAGLALLTRLQLARLFEEAPEVVQEALGKPAL